jgi:hypothetical protein
MVKLVWVKWIIAVSMLGINGYILSVKTRKTNPSIIPLSKIKSDVNESNKNP